MHIIKIKKYLIESLKIRNSSNINLNIDSFSLEFNSLFPIVLTEKQRHLWWYVMGTSHFNNALMSISCVLTKIFFFIFLNKYLFCFLFDWKVTSTCPRLFALIINNDSALIIDVWLTKWWSWVGDVFWFHSKWNSLLIFVSICVSFGTLADDLHSKGIWCQFLSCWLYFYGILTFLDWFLWIQSHI